MTEAEIYDQLNDIFREMFADDRIALKPATTADDIDGWDSFNHLQIIVAVESRFRIKMSTAEIESLKSVGDLVRVIEARGAARG